MASRTGPTAKEQRHPVPAPPKVANVDKGRRQFSQTTATYADISDLEQTGTATTATYADISDLEPASRAGRTPHNKKSQAIVGTTTRDFTPCAEGDLNS